MSLYFTISDYNSVADLIDQFDNLDVFEMDTLQNPNFVLIRPENYIGTYCGIIRTEILNHYSAQLYASSKITPLTSIVWWHTSESPIRGVVSLTKNGLVAVTPDMVPKMVSKLSCNGGKSSYFVQTARMKRRSSSNSDSE